MAITRIHPVKATIGKTVTYICNPHKTDGEILVSSFACSPKTAVHDFNHALSYTNQKDSNLGFHLIQSFAPGEVSFDMAHQIGKELADKHLEGKYSYIVTTHVDHKHIHNHIVFCAADNLEHHKYNDCKRSYYQIRQISDDLCKEHELSIVIPGQKRGLKYNEWVAQKNGTSWKVQLKNDIDECIKVAKNYDDFIRLMREKNYTVENEVLGDPSAKYIKFKPEGRERFIRGCARSLGSDDYTKERIAERISEEISRKEEWKKKAKLRTDHSSRSLIDTTGEKFRESPGLQHWAKVQNLKIAASAYRAAGSLAELEKEMDVRKKTAQSARSKVVELEHTMKELGELLHYAETYQQTRKYQFHYEKSKNPDAYFRTHESDLILYAGAENMLKKFGVNPRSMNLEKLRNDYSAMASEKSRLQQEYKTAEKELSSMQKEKATLAQYLHQDHPAQQLQKDKNRE